MLYARDTRQQLHSAVKRRPGVTNQRLKTRAIFWPVQVGRINFNPERFHQQRGALTHQTSWSEYFPRLFFSCGPGIYFSAKLVITGKTVQRHTCRNS